MKNRGFSIDSDIDTQNKQPGYIIFMRSSKNEYYNINQARYNYYNDEIYIPFANSYSKISNKE